MKKIVSILLCAMLLVSSVSAATLVEPSATNYADAVVISEDFTDGDRGVVFSLDQNVHAQFTTATMNADKGVIQISHKSDDKITDLCKEYLSLASIPVVSKTAHSMVKMSLDVAVADFDPEALGIEKRTALYVLSPRASKTTGTAWRYGGYGIYVAPTEDGYIYTDVNNVDLGAFSAEPVTWEFYLNFANNKYRMYVNDVLVKDWTSLSDDAIPLYTGLDGWQVNSAGLYAVEGAKAATIDIDNLVVTSNPTDLGDSYIIADEIAVTADGEIEFGVALPAGFGTADAYLNDAFLATIVEDGATSYDVKADLPAGYAYKDTADTLKITFGDTTISKEVNIVMRDFAGETVALSSVGNTNSDGRIKTNSSIGSAAFFGNGVYALEFKINASSLGTSELKLNLCNYDAGRGPAWDTDVAPRFFNQNTSGLKLVANRKIVGTDVALSTVDTIDGVEDGKAMNTVRIVVDYASQGWDKAIPTDDFSAKALPRPYKVYLNGVLAKESIFTCFDEASYSYYLPGNLGITSFADDGYASSEHNTSYTDPLGYYNTKGEWPAKDGNYSIRPNKYNGFTEIRFGSGIASVDTASLTVTKIIEAPEYVSASATYADDEVEYAGSAITAFGLEKLNFTFSGAFGDVVDNAKLVDAAGNEVSDVTFAANGNVISAIPSSALPTGSYKLVLDKDATVDGNKLGAAIESAAIAVSNASGILTPAEGAVVTGTSMELSAYIPDATSVKFFLNEKEVVYTDVKNDVYSVTCAVENNGMNKFEVVYTDGEGKHSISRAFTTSAPMKYNYYAGVHKGGTIGNNTQTTSPQYTNTSAIVHSGRVCLEGTVSGLSTTEKYYLDIGTNRGDWFGTDATGTWGALSGGVGVSSSSPLFGSGKVGTSASTGTYTADEEFNFKYVIDFNENCYELYKNGVLVDKTSNVSNLDTNKNVVSKVRLYTTNGATLTLSNYQIYNEAAAPAITGLTGATKVGGSYVLRKTADSIAVTFDKAYAAITKDDVAITKADGTAVTFDDVAYDAGSKTATIKGISGIKAGDILKVTVKETATASAPYSYVDINGGQIPLTEGGSNKFYKIKYTDGAFATGTAVNATVYVADANGLFKYAADVTVAGASTDVEIKYINAGNAVAAGDDTIYFAAYTPVNDSQKLANVESASLAFETGDGFFNASANFAANKVMLWNKATFAPLADLLN